MAKATGEKTVAKKMSKSTLFQELAETTGLTRKQVSEVFAALHGIIKKELGGKGPGVLALPGLVKLTRVIKPARKAGERANPFKPGEMMKVAAKPASKSVKVRPLKDLKELVK